MKKLLSTVAIAALATTALALSTPVAVPKAKKADVVQAMPVPVGMFKGEGPRPSPSYRNTYIDTSNATNYTLNSCDIGTAHSKRVVVLVVFTIGGSAVTSSITVNGVSATSVVNSGQASSRATEIWQASVPTGTSVTIQVNGGASCTALAVSVYALYPLSATAVDAVGNNSASSNTSLLDVAKTNGGFTIIGGTHNTVSSVGTVTQNGAETIVQDYQGNPDAGRRCVSASHVNTATTTTNDYTISWTGTVNGRGGCAASWGP